MSMRYSGSGPYSATPRFVLDEPIDFQFESNVGKIRKNSPLRWVRSLSSGVQLLVLALWLGLVGICAALAWVIGG